MTNRRTFLAGAGIAALGAVVPGIANAATTDRLKSLVDSQLAGAAGKGYPSLVIGLFDRHGQYVAGTGNSGQPDGRRPDGRTVYQIGSITKTFTGLAVALEVVHGRRRFEDPLQRYLPGWLHLPTWQGRQITIGDVATHTSGIPSFPESWKKRPDVDWRDPYAIFTLKDVAETLRETTLPREPGKVFDYSNLATGLQGQSLAIGEEAAYESVVRPRITGPLGLRDTSTAVRGEQYARKAVGHNESGAVTPDWHVRTCAAAGALYGTVDDLLRYVRAYLAPARGPLGEAMRLVRQPRFAVDPVRNIGVNWLLEPLPRSGKQLVWHNGGTGGFRSFAGFCPDSGTGVAILTNIAKEVDPIAVELLDAVSGP
ncbi:serine hydrolase domain-containing protein [Amycolatopsis sp. NPDC059027]|uniref:serine hydrolase domain-containing protein n=1 Tax=Amycolatopsis sp. NPDC059027 TaxID=3346709 RepID=UPI00367353CB